MPSSSFSLAQPRRAAAPARSTGTPATKGYFVQGNKGSLGFIADPRRPQVLTYLHVSDQSKAKIKRYPGDTITTARASDWTRVNAGTINLSITLP